MTVTHKVSEVAAMAGVTVRTLHHYDAIGLLSPSKRTDSGYRSYDRGDLERLQQVLLYRELGLGLEAIKAVMDDPGFDRVEAFLEQRKRLTRERDRISGLIGAIDRALAAIETGVAMKDEEVLEVFGDFDPRDHEDEARQRWPDQYAETAAKTSKYTKADWERLKAEGDSITRRLNELRMAGTRADSQQAMDLAEEHRAHISRWFYECTPEIHTGLATMYLEDERFTQAWDQYGVGLAQYVHDAFWANGVRLAS